MFSKYCYDGKKPFHISKVSTKETSLCSDKKEAKEKMTENELRSYDSNMNIVRDAKNNKQYPLNLIENFK